MKKQANFLFVLGGINALFFVFFNESMFSLLIGLSFLIMGTIYEVGSNIKKAIEDGYIYEE
jgi:uncharacterized membrane protein HdeD (DUF308 family)